MITENAFQKAVRGELIHSAIPNICRSIEVGLKTEEKFCTSVSRYGPSGLLQRLFRRSRNMTNLSQCHVMRLLIFY